MICNILHNVTGKFIEMPRFERGFWPDNIEYFASLPHELGHFIPMREGAPAGLGDEYMDQYYNRIENRSTWLHSIMADNNLYVEFSTAMDYTANTTNGSLNPSGLRIDTDQAHINPEVRSCWQTIFRYYNYYSNERDNIMFDLNRDGIIDHDFPMNFVPESIGNYLLDWDSSYTFIRLKLTMT